MKVNIDKSVSTGLIIVPLVIGWGLTYYSYDKSNDLTLNGKLAMTYTSLVYTIITFPAKSNSKR